MVFLTSLKGYIEHFKKTGLFCQGVGSGIRKRVILLCVNVIFGTAGAGIIAPVLPEIQAWGNISTVQIGIFVSTFYLARVGANIPAGYLCDRYKRYILTAIGLSVVLTGLLISAFAESFLFLVAGRLVTGLGSSLVAVSIQTELLSLADFNNRSKFMSYFVMAHRTGESIFPFIGGTVAFIFNWRAVFIFCALLNLIGLAIALLPSRRSDLDVTEETDQTPVPASQKTEYKSKPDFKHLEGGRSYILLTLYLLGFFVFLNRFGMEMTIIPLYGSRIGLNSMQIGMVLSISSFISLVAILGGGYLADYYGRKLILLIGLALLLLANGLFLLVSSFWAFLLVKILFGIAAFTTALPTVIATDSVHPSRMGRALGGIRLFNDIGRLTGPTGLGWVMDRFSFVITVGVSMTTLITSSLMTVVFLKKTGIKSSSTMVNAS